MNYGKLNIQNVKFILKQLSIISNDNLSDKFVRSPEFRGSTSGKKEVHPEGEKI